VDNDILELLVGKPCGACEPDLFATTDRRWVVIHHLEGCPLHRERPFMVEVANQSLMDQLALSVGWLERQNAARNRL